jgi:hypothetical protein
VWVGQRRSEEAKRHWLGEPATGCPNAPFIHETAYSTCPVIRRVLEFGANDGGNLAYFLARDSVVQAVGIDINPIVTTPQGAYPQRYQGVVGDESALFGGLGAFDLAFTISVLDHMPDREVVGRVLARLVDLAPHVILLEPAIAGVEGDVSGKTRSEVALGLPRPHKRFAAHSYLWHYEELLRALPVSWTKAPRPLHSHSLGPFYQLFVIARRR